MQPIRPATLLRIVRIRRRAIFTRWEEAAEQSPISCKNETNFRWYSKTSCRKRESRLPRTETTGDAGCFLSSVVGRTRARREPSLSEIVTVSQSRFSSVANSSSRIRKQSSRGLDSNDNNDEEAKHIVSLLKDTIAHPVGSIDSVKLKEAGDALEYWVSASAAIPRVRKRRHNKNSNIDNKRDRHADEYRKFFENAKLICSRLVLEQNFHDDNYIFTEPNDTKATKSGLEDNNDRRFRDVREQWNESNETLNDESSYYMRPFLLNRVVDCWRIGWRDGRLNFTPNEMISWVEDLDNSRSDSRIISDSRTLTMIVDGICLRGDPYEAPLLAQWLLDRRLGQAYEDEDDTSLRPDTIFFTNVIRSWAKSGRVEAPEMADGLLQMMHELYSNSGWIESAPNAFSYAATMDAWSKSHRRPDSINRIEALLEEMKNSSLMQVVPDRVSYQYVLNAWANSKTTTGGEKAFDVLQEMIALYRAGNVLVAPNASNFSRVILALAQSGNDEKVDSVLEQLQDLYSETGDPNFQPTDECWKACIIAKAKTGGVAEAQGILDDFVERAISKSKPHLMPRRSYFVDTLVAWTKIKDQIKAAEMSQKVLDRMVELAAHRDDSYRSLQPDAKTYEKVILAWSRSRYHSAPERIHSLLSEMERRNDMGDHKMRPSLIGYTNLMLAWQRSGREESTDAIQHVFDSLQIQYKADGQKHLRPDRYIFGILIDSWAFCKDLDRVESIFEEMMNEWRNGNNDAQPDMHIFHNILRAHSKVNEDHGDAVMKCEYYFSLMKEVGLPTTIQAYSYLIDALSSKSVRADARDISRASAVLDELLESACKGTTFFPPKHREYRQFLKTVSNSCIPHRNKQAKKVLMSLSRASGGPVPKELLPP